jgi:hypothetical protein
MRITLRIIGVFGAAPAEMLEALSPVAPEPLAMTDALLHRRSLLAGAGATLAVACVDRARLEPSAGAAAASEPGDACWEGRPPLPFAVQEIYPAVLDGQIHVAGGFLLGGGAGGRGLGPTARHVAYNPATGSAAELGALPQPRHHPHLVAHGGRLYALGGFGAEPGAVWRMSDETLVYEPAAGSWTALAAAPGPHGEVVAASLGERIHLVGGRAPRGEANGQYGDHGDVDRHWVFDPAAGVWETAAPARTARNSAAGAVIDGRLFVVGGRRVGEGNVTPTEVYDPAEDRWRAAAPMPQGQGGLAAAVLDGALYAFGGEQLGEPRVVYPEVWRYDPAADAWSAAPALPTPRHGLGAVTVGEAIYVVGGAREVGGAGTSDAVERLSVVCRA